MQADRLKKKSTYRQKVKENERKTYTHSNSEREKRKKKETNKTYFFLYFTQVLTVFPSTPLPLDPHGVRRLDLRAVGRGVGPHAPELPRAPG